MCGFLTFWSKMCGFWTNLCAGKCAGFWKIVQKRAVLTKKVLATLHLNNAPIPLYFSAWRGLYTHTVTAPYTFLINRTNFNCLSDDNSNSPNNIKIYIIWHMYFEIPYSKVHTLYHLFVFSRRSHSKCQRNFGSGTSLQKRWC